MTKSGASSGFVRCAERTIMSVNVTEVGHGKASTRAHACRICMY